MHFITIAVQSAVYKKHNKSKEKEESKPEADEKSWVLGKDLKERGLSNVLHKPQCVLGNNSHN